MSKKRIVSPEERFTGVLWGIVAQVKEYQLCWHLNKTLGFDLKRGEDVEVSNRKKNKTSFFSFYRYSGDLDKWEVFVVGNKHFGEFLVPEVKQTDFFLMIRGEVSEKQEAELFGKLKSIPVMQLVVKIDYDRLKSRENLILE
ncbi:MAG TPA: IPExxxVDY family protein [Chitinophagales bacterium]|nr:IPExxxVDY family protein [Chitinophagales bacterium]